MSILLLSYTDNDKMFAGTLHRVWKKTYSFPRITLTNVNVFLLLLAHIIPMIRFIDNM